MVLRRIYRFLGFYSRARNSKSLIRWTVVTFSLVVIIFHVQLQITGNIHSWQRPRGHDNYRGRSGALRGDGETFAWYGGNDPGGGDKELFYIDVGGNTEDEKPIPPPVNFGGPRRLILGKKDLLPADDSAKTLKDGAEDVVPDHQADDVSHIGLKLQPWASGDHSLDAEVGRFLRYITTIQKTCPTQRTVGCHGHGCKNDWPLSLCFQGITQRHHCIVYSFRSSFPSLDFENELADGGCEVHIFDPTQRAMRYEPRARNHKDVERNLVFHRITLDWREASSDLELFGPPTLRAKNLQTIMAELGHEEVHVLRVDLESSEWKIIEGLLMDGWISRIHQLIVKVHLHWSGFEVSGSKPSVVRFWYSVLSGLGAFQFRLFESAEDATSLRMFLGEAGKFNTSSTYTLGWMKNL